MYIILGVYTIFLLIIWAFFIIAKIHAYKFKDFSSRIAPVTKIILIILIILSLIGYATIFYMHSGGRSPDFNFSESDYHFNEINY